MDEGTPGVKNRYREVSHPVREECKASQIWMIATRLIAGLCKTSLPEQCDYTGKQVRKMPCLRPAAVSCLWSKAPYLCAKRHAARSCFAARRVPSALLGTLLNRPARIRPCRLAESFSEHGIHSGQARCTALFQLATDLPAAVLARLPAIHITVAVAWQRASADDRVACTAEISAGSEQAGTPNVNSRSVTTRHGLNIIQLRHPGDADPAVRQELTACWIAVTNAGGAAGFPFPPVNVSHVAPAVDTIADGLESQRSQILLARRAGALAGWVVLSRDLSPLIAHWEPSTTCRPSPDIATRASGRP